MATETTTLRIKAERLGSIRNVVNFLNDLENAYNSIYAFDFIVDMLASEREKFFTENEERSRIFDREEYIYRKEFPYSRFYFDLFRKYSLSRPNLFELYHRLDLKKIVLPEDRLNLSKVNIQSPGFWEFMGSISPLEQIRKALNDYHERKKDKKYRNRQQEALGDLAIVEKKEELINKRIETLKNLGYTDLEIRQMVSTLISDPINRLNWHQDNGQIETPD